jgi:hypothetical protein
VAQAIPSSLRDRPAAARTDDAPTVVKADSLEARRAVFCACSCQRELPCSFGCHTVRDRIGGVRPRSADPARHLGWWGADRTRVENLTPAFLRPFTTPREVKVDSIMATFGLFVDSRGRMAGGARASLIPLSHEKIDGVAEVSRSPNPRSVGSFRSLIYKARV